MTAREAQLELAFCCAVAMAYTVFAARQVYPFAPDDINRVNDYLRGREGTESRVVIIGRALQEIR